MLSITFSSASPFPLLRRKQASILANIFPGNLAAVTKPLLSMPGIFLAVASKDRTFAGADFRRTYRVQIAKITPATITTYCWVAGFPLSKKHENLVSIN